ncbi:MAG: hypothetical protein ABWK00_05315 [Desulfurococcaceae archaeon]
MGKGSMSSARRKTFAAREDLIDAVKGIAKSKGKSLYDYVNELFESAIELERAGGSLKEAVEGYALLKEARDAGLVLVPEVLLYGIIDAVAQGGELGKVFHDAGVWLSTRYVARYGQDAFERMARELPRALWNYAGLRLENRGDKLLVEFVAPRLGERYVALFNSFFEGIMEGLGYEVVERKIVGRISRLTGVRRARGPVE